MNELIDFLLNQDVEYSRNLKMSHRSAIAIGGVAEMVVFPDSLEKLVKTLDFLIDHYIKFKLIGNLTNTLLPDEKISLVLVSTLRVNNILLEKNLVSADCGVLFTRLINDAAKHSLGGYEPLFGIPGTVGAMVSINAGAYGMSASDLLDEVTVYNPFQKNNRVYGIKKENLSFFYRDSDIKRASLIVLGAKFSFIPMDEARIYGNINDYRNKRIKSQPISFPSLGSVFRKNENFPASYMIDKCGLKGISIGGIAVSEKHAGFFVNTGGGTATDFKKLAFTVKNRVREVFGIELTEEVEYLEQ